MKLDSFLPTTLEINNSSSSIRLDQSESSYPPSPQVIHAICNATSTLNKYPFPKGGDYLREKLTIYTGAAKTQIVIGNGSDDLIELILKVFVHSNDQVLLPIPTFPGYSYAAENLGKEVIYVNPTDGFRLDVISILQKVTPKVRVIFIANPNNPTANLIRRSTLIEIIRQVNCLVVVDECYYEFSQETVADLTNTYPNLIVLRSFSKGFALAGLRIGYAITNSELASRLRSCTQFFGVNALAQAAAITTLDNLEYYRTQIKLMQQERTHLGRELSKLGFDVYPSNANFLFVGTQKLNIPSSYIAKSLQGKNIYVKDCTTVPGLDNFYFRTSIGNENENQVLLNELARLKHVLFEN
jgi:histidinol-phosphate aminotransferase